MQSGNESMTAATSADQPTVAELQHLDDQATLAQQPQSTSTSPSHLHSVNSSPNKKVSAALQILNLIDSPQSEASQTKHDATAPIIDEKQSNVQSQPKPEAIHFTLNQPKSNPARQVMCISSDSEEVIEKQKSPQRVASDASHSSPAPTHQRKRKRIQEEESSPNEASTDAAATEAGQHQQSIPHSSPELPHLSPDASTASDPRRRIMKRRLVTEAEMQLQSAPNKRAAFGAADFDSPELQAEPSRINGTDDEMRDLLPDNVVTDRNRRSNSQARGESNDDGHQVDEEEHRSEPPLAGRGRRKDSTVGATRRHATPATQRYFDESGANAVAAQASSAQDITTVCHKCEEVGHRSKDCPNDRLHKICFLCGSRHPFWTCHNDACHICQRLDCNAQRCTRSADYQLFNAQLRRLCLRCGSHTHTNHRECKSAPSSGVWDLSQITCHVCGRSGHFTCQSVADTALSLSSPASALAFCMNCNSKSHSTLNCSSSDRMPYYVDLNVHGGYDSGRKPLNRNPRVQQQQDKKCFACGQSGHERRNCPQTHSRNRGNADTSVSGSHGRSFANQTYNSASLYSHSADRNNRSGAQLQSDKSNSQAQPHSRRSHRRDRAQSAHPPDTRHHNNDRDRQSGHQDASTPKLSYDGTRARPPTARQVRRSEERKLKKSAESDQRNGAHQSAQSAPKQHSQSGAKPEGANKRALF